MKQQQHPLFTQVAIAQDIPAHNLKRGAVGTIVEHYPMSEGEDDDYSVEGFDLPNITLEVPASQIMPIAQWHQKKQTDRQTANFHYSPLIKVTSQTNCGCT